MNHQEKKEQLELEILEIQKEAAEYQRSYWIKKCELLEN
jgi:hypothetical protein